MARLIDAEALYSKLRKAFAWKDLSEEQITIYEAIDAAPTVDAEPARRGKWKWLDHKEAEKYAPLNLVWSADNWICSECKNFKAYDLREIKRFAYCDKCGARMDGESK